MIPETGIRSLPEDLVDRMTAPAPPPPWLGPLAELVVEKLKPVVRSEIQAALKAEQGRAE